MWVTVCACAIVQGALALLALKASEPMRGLNAVAHGELASGITQWLLDFSSKARTVKVWPLPKLL